MSFRSLLRNTAAVATIGRWVSAMLLAGALGSAAPTAASAGSPVVQIVSLRVDSRHHQATALFSGSGGAAPLRYWCLIDGSKGRYCHSPLTMKRLHRGVHKLMIEAEDSTGLVSTFWAIRRFRVK
jgi:hypothetical protein